ncbi:DUF378 domain-containing protein [Clostridium sp. MB40-C1]|uniref:DUF378 domain-containing protein n=1 Tax=Clostridium sp. MB40-C1 TaxID=3070996 RepID=UPI0027DF02FD|nr:DUF378 domain-containing protein [Clostridium sp. MB40-C1]WMJ82006.1 DUF378 domain-containing protein [Clostridium sp. MB40-C1]
MYKLNSIDKISFVLIIIGAINWGVIGLFDKNLVNLLFSFAPLIERLIYILVGLSAINTILFIKKSKHSK